jgi:hypothetical protein
MCGTEVGGRCWERINLFQPWTWCCFFLVASPSYQPFVQQRFLPSTEGSVMCRKSFTEKSEVIVSEPELMQIPGLSSRLDLLVTRMI